MAIVASDWTVTRSTGNIRYIGHDHGGGSPSYATVIEFHRWLQDLADDASSAGDDEIDMTDVLPSDRSTDNIITLLSSYNITNAESEHLYDGSIIQDSGNDIWDGIINFGNADVQIQIQQNGAVLADDWWNFGGAGLNADSVQGISHRFMVPVRVGGTDIDNKKLLGTTRVFGETYSEFPINATARGNNVLALKSTTDLNNTTLIATIAAIADIVNVKEGYSLIDVSNDSVDEPYFSEWDRGANSINTFYERMKWLTRDGSASTIYGLNGELFRGISHQVAISGGAGTWVEPESLSWGTGATAGTGQLLAVDNTTSSSATKMWIQLLTGVIPNANTITGNGGATATAGTVTERAISTPFAGASTGSALIGSYGFGIEVADLSANDQITDLDTTLNIPPNVVAFSVSGLVIGEDRVLVGPWDGVTTDAEGNPALEKDQLTTTAVIINGAGVTSIPITTAIPTDTPATGDLRVLLASGKYREIAYTSYSGSTFTIPSTDFSSDQVDASSNLWIAYLDLLATATSESFSGVYLLDRDFVVIARDGGGTPIKQFISSASNSSTGGSITVIRTSDA